jgi:internalin A
LIGKRRLTVLNKIAFCSGGLLLLCILAAAVSGFAASYNVDTLEENMLYTHSILGIDSLKIFEDVVVQSGNVGVLNHSAYTQEQVYSFYSSNYIQNDIHIDADAYFEQDTCIYGGSVRIERGSSVYNVYSDELVNEGEIRGEAGLFAEQSYEVYLPEFPEPEPGVEEVVVYWNERRVLPPGRYGKVTVRSRGTLVLLGGSYQFESLEVGYYRARVLIQGQAEVVIKNRLFSFIRCYIGPDKGVGITAKDIGVYVYGEDGRYGFYRGFPKAVYLGRYSEVHANLYAPNGTLWIGHNATAKGAFVGRDVVVGYDAEITLDSLTPKGVISQFADPNLEAAVREALEIPEGVLLVSDLEGLYALNASGREIEDLRGIEDCINLMSLVLEYNEITDIGPLAGLINLMSLNLNDNAVTDLGPLRGLLGLSRLYLGGNGITDDELEHLRGLVNLSNLVLDYNGLKDIGPLAELTKLRSLVLNDNAIEELSALSGLTGLSVLYLYNNAISDIGALKELTGLSVLYLYNNDISDITPLWNLSNLVNLVLDYNRISDISPLSGLTKLSVLYLNVNQISDLSALAGLQELKTLVLDTNQITDISALAGLSNLTELYLGENEIEDISPLQGLLGLYALYLYSNNINDISPLAANSAAGGLGMGDMVYVYDNPLEGDDVDEHIAYLEQQGVLVYWYSSNPF